MAFRVLDGKRFASGSAQERAEFCEALVDGFSQQGLVKLVNHGISDGDIEQAFQWSKRLFQLPGSAKEAIRHPPQANPNRGWTCPGQEKSWAITDFEKGTTDAAAKRFDLKESFDMGAPDDALYANMWPTEHELPGIRDFLERFYEACQEVHLRILEALEQGLRGRGIEVDLVGRCRENVSELRLNYYPPVQVADVRSGKLTRISEHTDFGTVTLLLQDTVGGLEVEQQDQPGQYISVEADSKTEMLVNIGDSLQRLTNDVLTSVSHRVTVPRAEQTRESGELQARYSLAYFAKFSRDVSLRPLAAFVDAQRPPKYPDMTAYEWNQVKLQRIYG
ncbi:hypothetical protein MPH_07438 [Macrophomina phaseolina MS6]|uniref:Fe2OG dioxygenase domain-containing protein n=2 Tax=Macrophomina phaseolina TaxID=35725 RepID=K2RRL8_MACPH|nr:hypothetical protein MPH_07438 [Macrophomina phaseolina MS6]KAH7048287.1 gibberellin 20-oxidase [Macrophomina phaseolina]